MFCMLEKHGRVVALQQLDPLRTHRSLCTDGQVAVGMGRRPFCVSLGVSFGDKDLVTANELWVGLGNTSRVIAGPNGSCRCTRHGTIRRPRLPLPNRNGQALDV
jgi:hypothetical protein